MENCEYIKSIQNLLVEKRHKNANYSIRALARDLDIPPSSLVDIIHGKKTVTPKIAYKIGAHMKLDGHLMLAYILPSLKLN